MIFSYYVYDWIFSIPYKKDIDQVIDDVGKVVLDIKTRSILRIILA